MSKQEVRVGRVWQHTSGVLRTIGPDAPGIGNKAGPAWTLVQDVPEARGIEWATEYLSQYLPTPEAVAYVTCLVVNGTRCGASQGSRSHIPGCPAGPAPFQQDDCSALRGTLPVSERFVEPNATAYSVADYAAPEFDAHADLRRKVSSLRSWPVCPVSKQDLRIEATVSEEKMVSELKEGAHPKLPGWHHETLRTWQAAFTCPHCTGGGR